MRILYVASGIRVPGAFGGAIHTTEVAAGLAALGHEVHVVARPPAGTATAPWRLPARRLGGYTVYDCDLPKGLALLATPLLARLIRRIRPDAVMERYYNFAGDGVLAASSAGLPALLEVNALMVDPPAVRKRRIDDRLALLLPGGAARGGPFRRWAAWQCRRSARIITPLQTTVPPEIDRARIVELPWGANVADFQPAAAPGDPLGEAPVIAFLGSFRHWHGVLDFVRAALLLLGDGFAGRFLLIGDGPERAEAERLAAPHAGRFEWTGAVAHEQVPALLARATVGVAPFNTAPHPALRAAGFFWSPLKIYEYMAAGLPVVTARIAPLDTVIREGSEGALFAEGDVADLARVVRRVAESPERAAMGARARARVVERYSWAAHCRELERILGEMARQRRRP